MTKLIKTLAFIVFAIGLGMVSFGFIVYAIKDGGAIQWHILGGMLAMLVSFWVIMFLSGMSFDAMMPTGIIRALACFACFGVGMYCHSALSSIIEILGLFGGFFSLFVVWGSCEEKAKE